MNTWGFHYTATKLQNKNIANELGHKENYPALWLVVWYVRPWGKKKMIVWSEDTQWYS